MSMEPLTGKVLLEKVKELSHLTRQETAKACGYYSLTKTGRTRISLSKFYAAVIAAKGVALDSKSENGRGREAAYRVSVHKGGQIVIGSAYTEAMGLQPGDEFEIKLGSKHIHLIQVEGRSEEAANSLLTAA